MRGDKRASIEIMKEENPNFGQTADDYAKHLRDFLRSFSKNLRPADFCALRYAFSILRRERAQSLGVWRDSVFACDIAKELLAKADELALAEGRSIEFKEARSEATGDRINFLISLSSVKLGTGSIMSRRSQK